MAITFEFEGKEFKEKMQVRDELIAYLKKHYPFEKVRATLHYSETDLKKRIGVYNKDVFIYAKGRRRWGNYLQLGDSYIKSITVPEKRKSKEEVWRDSWQTVIDYLEQSGLWENYCALYKLGLDIGLEKIKQAERLYWKKWDDGNDETVARVKELDERLIKTNEQGEEFIDTRIVWYMNQDAKVKTIYFGRYNTDKTREELKQAIENKEEYHYSKQVPNYYDCSVSYNPEVNRGWYNEEYRNCGNGHYYVLLDHEHALFVEDD